MRRELEKEMIRRWNDGESAGQIGDAIGVTRQVVLGRIKRLRDKGDTRITRGKSLDGVTQGSVRRRPKVSLTIVPKPSEPEPLKVTLLDRSPEQCAWMVGEPEEMLCCGLSVDKSAHTGSYCSYHNSRAYTKNPGTEQDRKLSRAASRNSGSMRQFG